MEQQVLDDPRVNEALNLLNDVAKDKKEQLRKLVNDRYVDIKNIVGSSSSSAESAGANAVLQTRNIVKRNPWPFLGGVAAAFLTIGFFIGRMRD